MCNAESMFRPLEIKKVIKKLRSTNLDNTTKRPLTPVLPAEWWRRVSWRCLQSLLLKLHTKIQHMLVHHWVARDLFICRFSLPADMLYLSDEFLLFGRFRHVGDLLVKFSEGRFSITLSLVWLDGTGAGYFISAWSHRGRRWGISSPRTERQVILESSYIRSEKGSDILLNPLALSKRQNKKMCKT